MDGFGFSKADEGSRKGTPMNEMLDWMNAVILLISSRCHSCDVYDVATLLFIARTLAFCLTDLGLPNKTKTVDICLRCVKRERERERDGQGNVLPMLSVYFSKRSGVFCTVRMVVVMVMMMMMMMMMIRHCIPWYRVREQYVSRGIQTN